MAGDAAAYQAMRQMQAQQRAQREAREDRMRAKRGQRGRRAAPAAEPMACPKCRAEYAFGDACPDCDVPLVGASWVAAVPPEPARPSPVRELLLGVALGVLSLAANVAWQHVYWGAPWWK